MNRPALIAEAYHGTITNYRYGCRCGECRAAHAAAKRARVGARRGLPDGDRRHGTENGYVNWRCACDACRAAWAAKTAGRRSRRPLLGVDDPRHGSWNGYNNYRCRCDACRAANAEQQRKRRAQVKS